MKETPHKKNVNQVQNIKIFLPTVYVTKEKKLKNVDLLVSTHMYFLRCVQNHMSVFTLVMFNCFHTNGYGRRQTKQRATLYSLQDLIGAGALRLFTRNDNMGCSHSAVCNFECLCSCALSVFSFSGAKKATGNNNAVGRLIFIFLHGIYFR